MISNRNARRLWLTLVLLIAALAACGAPAGDEPAAEEVPQDEVAALEPAELPTEDSDMEADTGESEALEPVAPVEVDLSKITPEAADPNAAPVEMPAPGVPGPGSDLMQAIVDDLARRRGVAAVDLDYSVVSAERRDWPDSALGCPARGMMYMQVITPGYLVEVEAGGENYSYHTDLAEGVVLCVDGQPAE